MRYAKKYCDCLLKNDFSLLTTFSNAKRNHTLKALSGLAKFLGLYQTFRELKRSYGLTWKTTSSEDLIISRLNSTRENGDILKWIRRVKKSLPELDVLLDLVLVSGLRFNESVKAYNYVIDLAREDRLNEYYNVEREVLEHFRFKEQFVRRTKKVFISFIPKPIIEKLCKQENLTEYQVINKIKRAGFQSRFSDIREYFATLMTRYLSQPEIDFL
jgi:intergrase/recombinase